MNTAAELGQPPRRRDRRAVRREATKAEIVAAAWEVVREHGLAGLAMRDLGERVGMKAQSIYSYFESKDEIYDAMFAEGYTQLVEMLSGGEEPGADADPVARATNYARRFFVFCTSDPVRYQLLFQRTIPGFEPSEGSFAVALQAYATAQNTMDELGVTDPAAIDLWTAIMTGLTDQQISNDPDGDRWERLIDRAVVMTLREIAPHLFTNTEGTD